MNEQVRKPASPAGIFAAVVLAIIAAVVIIGWVVSRAPQTATVTTCDTVTSQCYQTSIPVQP